MVPLSCELFNVGLGNKVDLYPPEVRITSPVNNAYVNYTDSKIVISGTVTDDGAISSVELIWESGTKSKRAVVSGNSWSVTFNKGELADGRYVFTARATDASNKSSEWQSTVNVDTTPPSGAFIFAADRGTSQDNPYNGKEKIQGMAEDGSGRLSSVVVTLGGVRIFPTDANPSPTASEVASWSVDLDFDDVVTGLVTDGSKWKDAAFTNISGNLYSAELKLIVTDQAGNSAEVTQTCYVDLTYDAPRITWPASLDVSTAANYPRNPTLYSGNIFKNGDTIDITVEDDDAVDRSSAKLVLETGTGTKYEYTVANLGLTANPSGTTKATSVRFRFTVPQETSLPQGEYKFSFEVSDDAAYKNGKDASTTKVENKSFVIDNGPPTLTVNPLASNVLRSDVFALSGTASDGWDIDSVQISLDGGVSWQDANLSGSAGSYTWTWNGTNTTEGYYNVQVRSVDRGGSKSSRDLQVTIDNTAPDLSFNQVYPIVESSDKRVNGIIKASVTAADTNGLAGVRYWTYTTTPPAESIQNWNGSGYVELSSAPYAVAIDTTSLTGTLYLRFGARDKAGNTTYITYDPLTIDQSTDNPTINLTNLNQLVSTWAGAAANLLESNARIIGLLSDDDGIDATTVQIRYTSRLESSSDPLVWGDWQAATSASTTSFDYTFPSDIPEGVRAVEVRVFDKASLKDGKPAVSTTIGPFYVAIDRQPPSLAVNSPSYGSYKGLGTFQIQGTASDSFALKDLDTGTAGTQAVIVRTLNADFTDTANNTLVTVASDGTWSYSYTVNAGIDETKTFYILAQDFFNKQTVITHQIRLDTVPPTISITNPAAAGSWFESLARFDGTANDTTGIKTIYYWIGNETDTPPAVGNAAWTSLAGNVNWSATVDLSTALEGSKKFWVYAEDLAGNVSTPQSLQFYLDKANPTISGVSVGDGEYRNATFSLATTVGDTYQLKSILVEQQQGSGAYVTIYSGAVSGTTSSVTVNNLPRDPGNPAALTLVDAEYTYRITVEDLAGKKTSLTRRIVFDDTKPVVEITSFTKYATANKVNKTVTFNSLASDANGLEGVKYFVSTNGTSAPAYDATVGGSIVQILTGQTIDTTTLADNTQYYLWVVARDKAGNEGASSAVGFYVDQSTDLPVVSLTSLDPSVTAESGILGSTIKNLLVSGGKISGTITDDDGVPDTATIWIDKNKDGSFGSGESYTVNLTGSTLSKSFDFDVSTAGLADGTYAFKIEVTDTTGVSNASMTPVWFAYDTAVPTVVLNANASDGNPVGPYRKADFTVQGTVQDANGISNVEFSMNSGISWEDLGITAASGENKAWSKLITAASSNGTKVLLVRATDKFGRVGVSSSVSVTIDTVAPTISVTSPGTFVAGPGVTITGTSSDSGSEASGLDKVYYRVDGGSWQEASGTASWNTTLDLDTDGTGPDTGLSEGNHTLDVYVTDKAGNQSSVQSITLMVDQNIPALATITIDGTTFGESPVFRTTGFTLAGSVTDTNGVASVSITQTKEGGSSEPVTVSLGTGSTSRTWTASISLSGEGSYTYTITVTDVAGRSTSASRTVVVDTQAPSAPTVSSPGMNSWILGTSYTVSGTASDVGSAGIGAVYYIVGPATGYTPPTDLAGWNLASGTESWSGTINLTALGEGAKKLFVKAVDKAGNVSAQTERSFGIDQSAPSISLTGPVATLANGSITFTGTASDSYLVALVTVAEKKPGDTSFTDIGTADYDSGTGIWSYTRNITGLSDGTYEYRITVTDGALKTTSVTKTITIDTTAPVVSFNQPAPYIEISGTVYGNGTMTMSGTASDLNGLAGLEYRVGGGTWQSVGTAPYISFTFAVNTTAYTDKADLSIEVRGTDNAGNVAVASYTIRVDQDTDKPTFTIGSPTEGGLVSSQTITISGSLADDDGLNDATLYYRLSADGGTTWSPDWTQIPASYLTGSATAKTLSSFSFTNSIDGAKVLQLKIADVNGTVATKSITFTQDAGAPTISNISPATTGYRNGDFTVSGTATDSQGTVTAVRYRVVKDGATVVVNWTACTLGSPGSATTSFTTGLIPTSSGTGIYQVTFETEDNAGNKRQESYAYTVDRTLPSGSFASPASGSTTNNIITLSGTASDNFGLGSLRLAIMKDGTEVADLGAPTGANDWSLSFDTRTYDESAYATLISGSLYEITLRLIITDVAGNIATVDRTFRIDQSTDIPQISFTTQQSVYLADSKIYGTATDDDGIASIEVSTDGGTNWTTLSAPTGGWGTSASWNYDLGSTDGAYSLRVRVTDVSSPAIVGTSSDATFLVDREAPDGAFTAPAANSKLKARDLTFTGTYGDENPVVSVQLKIDSSDFTSGAVTATMSGGSGSTSGTWTYTFATIPDGTRTIYARVTDAAGRTTLISRTVVVDTTGPVVTIIDPADLTSVYGKVSIRGSAEDTTTTIKNIKIGIGKTVNEEDYEGSPWYPATGTVSWSYTFNNISAYANTTYAVDIGDTDQDGVQDAGETWLNIWRMKIYIRAEDTAGLGSTGNISYVSTYTLEIDPNRDRPEVTVLDPDDGATIGGYKRIFGIAQDGQSIWKVQIAFDMNNDGDFNDAGDVWPSISGFTPPSADESDSSTTAWYLVNGTTSWYQTINLYGEFNPTGTDTTRTIKFKVRAWDYKTTPGDGIPGIEVVRTITFDKTVPQYADISHETGSTVGGSFTITGYVRDESGLQSIIFKHEGPRISSQELIGAASGQPRAVLVNSGEPGYVAGYMTYRLEIPINTTEAGLFPASSGIMAVALDAIDSSGFHSILSLSFNVDNILPSNLTYTAGSEIIGTQAEVQGTVRDTGIVSGIKQVVVYLKRGDSVVRLKGGSGSLDASGVLNLSDSAYNDYRIVIDNRLEDGNDTGSAGDNDGFAEWLTISGGVYNWAARFNSILVSDGKTEVNYVAYDFAGNTVSGSTNAYVANNKPSITSIVLGTDLNGDDDTDDSGEKTSEISSGYSATNFTARGNRLYIQVNATGGNGTKRYSITYNGTEQNGTLTSNTVTINTSSFAESSSANDRFFTILVYDSTTSDDDDSTDELTATITVGLTIDNVDEVAPAAWLYQLAASDVKDYNASDRSVWKGHIEPWNQSPYDNEDSGFNKTNEVFGNDADVSGTIVFRGGASDNQRINALYIWIDLNGNGTVDAGEEQQVAKFSGSSLVEDTSNTLGKWTATSESLTLAGGHTVEWTFEWDSSKVSGVARANVRIRVRAEDARPAASGGPNGSVQTPATPTDSTALTTGFNIMKVDVVPYVKDITTALSSAYASKPSAFNRSALGWYPVRENENITISGFNLNGTSTGVTINGTSITPSSGSTTQIVINTGTTATSGTLILTVNGVSSINNNNNNEKEWNSFSNGVNNAQLNDDTYLYLWKFNSLVTSSMIRYPSMRVSRSANEYVGFAYASGAQEVHVNVNGTDTKIDGSYTQWYDTGFAIDSNDRWYAGAMNGDYGGSGVTGSDQDMNTGTGGGWANFGFYAWQAGTNILNSTGAYSSGSHKRMIENANSNTAASPNFNPNRIQSPKMVTFVNGGTTNVFMSYYDASNNQVRYRYGTVSGTYPGSPTFGGNIANHGNVADGSAAGYHVVADGNTTTTYKAGQYSAIGITPDGSVAVIAWYDATNRKLMFSYNTDPTGASSSQWQTNATVIDADFSGWYVDLVVDDLGGIHIAYYNSSNGDLRYAYKSAYNQPATVVTVDSFLAVGTNISISWKTNGTKRIPYISYYMSSFTATSFSVKVAWLNGDLSDGVNNDMYTGSWEIMTVPTSNIPKDFTVGIGIKGNQPILGYATTTSLETAQLK
ncbi:hypothetical protein C5O22_03025 [Treponema sp. J25]|nr:hypothetical protein C5O22_03025 [Treponema sp. J25]